jgi:hypothetical protein
MDYSMMDYAFQFKQAEISTLSAQSAPTPEQEMF